MINEIKKIKHELVICKKLNESQSQLIEVLRRALNDEKQRTAFYKNQLTPIKVDAPLNPYLRVVK